MQIITKNMKKMTNLIIGMILIIIGYLIILNPFDKSTNHYSVEVQINDEFINTLTFSTVKNQPLTTEFLKNKFGYKSNDKFIILDIKSISRDEKDKICNKHE